MNSNKSYHFGAIELFMYRYRLHTFCGFTWVFQTHSAENYTVSLETLCGDILNKFRSYRPTNSCFNFFNVGSI